MPPVRSIGRTIARLHASTRVIDPAADRGGDVNFMPAKRSFAIAGYTIILIADRDLRRPFKALSKHGK